MLIFLTVVVMMVVAYAQMREGLFTAFTMCVNVMLAGLITFNFWEPAADLLDPIFADVPPIAGMEDAFAMVLIFCICLGLFRLASNSLAPSDMDYNAVAFRVGGGLFGLVAGYLLMGFLVCMFQTLPWHENFMSFDYRCEPNNGVRRMVPPDRIWQAMMHRAGSLSGPFTRGEDPDSGTSDTFDKDGTFSLRYGRYRRYNDTGSPRSYNGEIRMSKDAE